MSKQRLSFALSVATLLQCAMAAWGAAADNLLRNPGFEQALAPAWAKRTPEDAHRKLYRTSDIAHSDKWSVVLENVSPTFTRLRQGHDRSIVIEPGNLIELAAWVKSELSSDGTAMLQLYCMNEKGAIRAQPTSRQIRGPGDWMRMRVRSRVPDGTAYCMAYLQIRGGVGKVFFDDVALRIVRPPEPRKQRPRIGVLSDLADDDPCLANLRLLLGDGLTQLRDATAASQLRECAGALVLVRSQAMPEATFGAIAQFAAGGRPVFMDIRNFGQWRGIRIAPGVKAASSTSVAAQMGSGLRLVKESDVTAGFTVGQTIPRSSSNGTLCVLPDIPSGSALEALAVAPNGAAGLVRLRIGKGTVVAADVLSLREPYFAHVGAYYKYLFITNMLTSPVQFGEYYPKKLTYEQFVELMKEAAATFPEIRFQDEGPACGDYRIYSLNLGQPGAPMYFLYAAAHGSEWEPAYGLLTFAKRVAQGRVRDVVDLKRASIKIVPILNPPGYDLRRRQNAHGVDLNRQGDFLWEAYKGRDSTKDGKWGPGDYDWRGSSPFCEPEAKTYKTICEAENLYCVLDFHGNSSGTSNKVAILPRTALPENEDRAYDMQYEVNERLRGRYVLRQSREKEFSLYLISRLHMGSPSPYLMNTSARGRYGMLVELTAGYRDTYGTVLQTDVTCEVCRALLKAYPVTRRGRR